MKKTVRHKRSGKHRRQTAKSMLIRGFLQSFFIVAILLTAGTIGYRTTMKLWMIPEKEPVVEVQPEPSQEPITVPSVDEVSRNLIFCYNAETNIISKMVLEIFHCERKQLTYITLPTETQFTMSDILYRQLIAVQPSIPQMLRLSAMTRYLDASVVFDYGELMAEDMLGLEISYYTVIPVELFQTMFEEKSITAGITAADILEGNYDTLDRQSAQDAVPEDKQEGSPVTQDTVPEDKQEGNPVAQDAVPEDKQEGNQVAKDTVPEDKQEGNPVAQDAVPEDKQVDRLAETEHKGIPVVAQVFTKDYIETIDKLDSAEQISTYIEELYSTLQSNLPIVQKMNYLESYSKTSLAEVSFTRLSGFDKNNGFVMDQALVQQQLQELGVYDR